ncbi:MAG: M24 family metallopeptidase, partial [bacterium]
HGLGVNLDSVEAPDDRPLPPGGAFTIEPGLYLPGRWGMRTEIDVVLERGTARVTTTPFQTALLPILG